MIACTTFPILSASSGPSLVISRDMNFSFESLLVMTLIIEDDESCRALGKKAIPGRSGQPEASNDPGVRWRQRSLSSAAVGLDFSAGASYCEETVSIDTRPTGPFYFVPLQGGCFHGKLRRSRSCTPFRARALGATPILEQGDSLCVPEPSASRNFDLPFLSR
jgi:hypothetical protein